MTGDDITIEVLKGIREDIRSLTDVSRKHGNSIDGLRKDVRTLAEISREQGRRIDRMAAAMVRGFTGLNERIDQTNERLDNLRDLAGGLYRGLERRVGDLERRVDRLE
jgi:hypothetical protein